MRDELPKGTLIVASILAVCPICGERVSKENPCFDYDGWDEVVYIFIELECSKGHSFRISLPSGEDEI